MATELAGPSEIAARYAAALFELADEARALDAVADDLRTLRALLAESKDLARVIASPRLGRADQHGAIDAVMAAAGVGDLTRRFVGVVAHNRRLFALPGMITAFLADLAHRRGEVTASVVSATPLAPEQMTALEDRLRQSVGAKVSAEVTVDPALIGGMVVKVGSRMIDASVRSKLGRLRMAMRGTA